MCCITTIFIKFLMSILLIMSWNIYVINLKFPIYSWPREGSKFYRILIISQATCIHIVFFPLWKRIVKFSLLGMFCAFQKNKWNWLPSEIQYSILLDGLWLYRILTVSFCYFLCLGLLGTLSERESEIKNTIARIERQKNITGQKERIKLLVSMGI